MNTDFDSQRSEAIRAGLVSEVSPAVRQRRPWRGLALVLAGVLAGSGATTVAFANGRGLPLGPTAPPSSGTLEPTAVVVVGSDLEEEASRDSAGSVIVTTDPTSGTPRIEYQWTDTLRELSKAQMVVKEPGALDLSGHPAEASYAWVSFSCRGKGGIVMSSGGNGPSTKIVEGGDGDSSGGLTLATMLALNEETEQIKPTKGCVADATVTYYAKQ